MILSNRYRPAPKNTAKNGRLVLQSFNTMMFVMVLIKAAEYLSIV
jgi:hypothetical protein